MPSGHFPAYSVILAAPYQVVLSDDPQAELSEKQVRIQTLSSGISAGTELAFYRGTNPYLTKHWNGESRLFQNGGETMTFPIRTWGYEEVGRVVEIGPAVSKVKIGDIIWGTWGHKSIHITEEDWAAVRILPASLDPLCGIYSHVGAIGLNAVLDADIHVGEYVAVFGQGVMGLTVTQLARLNGATVIAVDGIEKRLELASNVGASHTINFKEQDPAEEIKRITENRGADVSIEITGSYGALHSAIRATAYNSRVVVSGFYQGEGLGLVLGEEFHHNRIQLISSQISGSAAALSLRWNRLRLNQTIMQLQAEGRLDLKRFVTHIIPAAQVTEAFKLIDKNPNDVVQVVLKFAD